MNIRIMFYSIFRTPVQKIVMCPSFFFSKPLKLRFSLTRILTAACNSLMYHCLFVFRMKCTLVTACLCEGESRPAEGKTTLTISYQQHQIVSDTLSNPLCLWHCLFPSLSWTPSCTLFVPVTVSFPLCLWHCLLTSLSLTLSSALFVSETVYFPLCLWHCLLSSLSLSLFPSLCFSLPPGRGTKRSLHVFSWNQGMPD